MSVEADAASRVLYAFEWQRRRVLRRAWMTLIFASLLFGLFIALGFWRNIDPDQLLLLSLSRRVAVLVAAMFALRAVFNLGRAMFRHTQIAQFSREGFAWQVDNDIHRYPWEQLRAYRKGARIWRVFRLPVRRFGQHRLTMNDGRAFVLHHGMTSPELFERAMDPIIDALMGEKIANTLRAGGNVRLHKHLFLTKNGVVVLKGGKKIGIKWSSADIRQMGGQLGIYAAGKNGKFKLVRRFPVHTVDNLGGFLELADATLSSHQPERFNLKTVGQNPRR